MGSKLIIEMALLENNEITLFPEKERDNHTFIDNFLVGAITQNENDVSFF